MNFILQKAGAAHVNDGTITVPVGGSLIVVIEEDSSFTTGPLSTITSMDTTQFANGGTFYHLGEWQIQPGASGIVNGQDPANFDPVTQTWQGGRIRIQGPGEFCMPFSNPMLRVAGTFHCIGEVTACPSGAGSSNPFAAFEFIEKEGAFILEGMPFNRNGNLENSGALMLKSGADMNVAGNYVQQSGNTSVADSSLAADSVVLMGGMFTGDGEITGPTTNHAVLEPGQSASQPGLAGGAGNGSTGELQINGSFAQTTGALLRMKLGGVIPGQQFDKLTIMGGTATLNGTLELQLIDSFVPEINDEFVIITADSRIGEFPEVVLSEFPLSLSACVLYQSGNVVVKIVPGAITGDMNCDGLVTVGDIGGFVLALTDPNGYAMQFPDCDINRADVNNDGVVTVGDIAFFVQLLTTPVCS
ncbi:MAG: hypothetical protein AB7N71_05630 [Phycisphaerae bacterium]